MHSSHSQASRPVSNNTLTGPAHKHSKLSTQIADLARAVPQRTAPLAPGENVSAPGFSIAKLPKSAHDSIKAGHIKVGDTGEVQVYIELNEMAPENLAQLQSYVVTANYRRAKTRQEQRRSSNNGSDCAEFLTCLPLDQEQSSMHFLVRAVSPGPSAKPRPKGFFALPNLASQKDRQVRRG